jgi:hypothetical protein
MAEAFITRRGSAMKVGTAHATGFYNLTIPDLIGAKNALIGLCPNPQQGMTSTSNGVVVSIVIEDGNITSAYYFYKVSSYASISPLNDLTFDVATGTLSKPSGSLGEFAIAIDYKYVVY